MFRWRAVARAGALLLLSSACGPASTAAPPPASAVPTLAAAAPTAEASPTADLALQVMSLEQPFVLRTIPSPDGAWTARVLIYDCVPVGGELLAYDVLELRHGEEDPVAAASQLQSCQGLGAHGLEGRFWSPGSRYFYFTDAREGSPDGGCGYWAGSLARWDVATGRVEPLGGAVASPDGTRLAAWAGDGLAVWSLDGPSPAVFPVAHGTAVPGPIAWAPDGLSLATLMTAEICPPWGKSWLDLHSLSEGTSRGLLESEAPPFGGVEWPKSAMLRLTDRDGATWTYDLTHQTLTPPE